MNCLKCGKELQDREGSGRPRRYCGETCQKTTMMEIRRLNARIAQLEKSESLWRIKGAERWAANAAKEIERQEARLAELISAERDESADV